MFDGTPLGADTNARAWKTYYVEWLNVRYEEDVVSAEWPTSGSIASSR
jgi:hypothetical protein